MGDLLFKTKQGLWKIIALVLFYSGILRLIHYLVDGYQCEKNSSGRTVFPYFKRRLSRSVQILTYHRVNDEHDPFFPAIPTRIFAHQMEYLASNFLVCPLADLIERIRMRDIPENAVAITFDDGYRDNYLNAFPILCRLSLPATIFLATGAIGSGKILWHDRVFHAFRKTQASFLDDFNTGSQRLSLKSLSDKLVAQSIVLDFLWSQSDDEREIWIERLLDRLEVTDRKEQAGLMLSWDDVAAMHQAGIAFGSHTVSHPILSRLSEERIKQEIAVSKREIQNKLQTRADTFAYPVGRKQDYNELTKSLLKEAGYSCALTTAFGTNEAGQDTFELRRIMPWPEDPYTFGLRLSYYRLSS